MTASITIIFGKFEWNRAKEIENNQKHKMDFYLASLAFLDPQRIISTDEKHSHLEERMFCIGRVGKRIVTVRFTMRKNRIRIIGAGFWKTGKKLYEEKQKKQNY